MPRDEVVASSLPEGGTDKVLSAEWCAAMIDTGCFVGAGGGFGGGVDEDADMVVGDRRA